MQAERFKGGGTSLNAYASSSEIEATMSLKDNAKALLTRSAEQMSLSARAYYRLIRVCRTIADLDDNQPEILDYHVAEALSYARKDY